MARYDVIIIGGGAVGTAAAYHFARRGVTRVLLLERLDGWGRGATGVWGSLVRMFHKSADATRAATRAVPFYADFERHVGVPFEWHRCGSLYFMKRGMLPQFQPHLDALAGSGLPFGVVEPDRGRRQFPDFAWFEDDVAIHEPQAGIASPRATTEAFLRYAVAQGAEGRLHAEVVEIVREGGRALGVRLADGSYEECDQLVVCAGIWTNALLGTVGASVNAFPVPIQLNRFSRRQAALDHPFFIDVAAATYGHPTRAGSFIGGCALVDLDHDHLAAEPPRPDAANRAKHEIARRIPWVKSATLEGGIRALESYAEGNCGFVERLAGFGNVTVSTGWSCTGFTLAPFIGEKIADVVLDNGQNAALQRHAVLKVKRPDRLRADISGNGNVRGIVYDGHRFTIFNEKKGYYARHDAPPTLDGLVHDLAANWHIETPLVDLFYWGNGKQDDIAITSAQVLGVEKVDTRACTHYAFRQTGADWELWIETGRQPLPCKMIITDTTQPTRPRHEVTYHWRLNPVFAASTFVFRPRPGARQIELKPADRPPYEEAQ